MFSLRAPSLLGLVSFGFGIGIGRRPESHPVPNTVLTLRALRGPFLRPHQSEPQYRVTTPHIRHVVRAQTEGRARPAER